MRFRIGKRLDMKNIENKWKCWASALNAAEEAFPLTTAPFTLPSVLFIRLRMIAMAATAAACMRIGRKRIKNNSKQQSNPQCRERIAGYLVNPCLTNELKTN